jgi:hypothetical protein
MKKTLSLALMAATCLAAVITAAPRARPNLSLTRREAERP